MTLRQRLRSQVLMVLRRPIVAMTVLVPGPRATYSKILPLMVLTQHRLQIQKCICSHHHLLARFHAIDITLIHMQVMMLDEVATAAVVREAVVLEAATAGQIDRVLIAALDSHPGRLAGQVPHEARQQSGTFQPVSLRMLDIFIQGGCPCTTDDSYAIASMNPPGCLPSHLFHYYRHPTQTHFVSIYHHIS